MDEAAQLCEALGRLSVKDALALARAVELARVRREEELPTDLVLAGLRPVLREAGAKRVPDLRRLVVRAFEPFLTDQVDEPRVPGLLPRAVILPWWNALEHFVAGAMEQVARRLPAVIADGSRRTLDNFAREAQEAASGWTRRLLVEHGRAHGDPAIRRLLPRQWLPDVMVMDAVLGMAEPLGEALAAVYRVLKLPVAGSRIPDLTHEAVATARQHYEGLSEAHGMDGCYLALALLNRLERPWQILRLGRALSWKPNDALVHDTEFGIVGERVIRNLEQGVEAIAAALRENGGAAFERLARLCATYMDGIEAVLGETGVRRGSSWGDAVLATRGAFTASLNSDWLSGVAAAAIRDSDPASADAIAAAELLHVLALRGARHGLAHVGEAVDALERELEEQAKDRGDAKRAERLRLRHILRRGKLRAEPATA